MCDQLLLTRATNIQVPSTEDPSKLVPKKMFYLVCGFCRWTTREAGLPDQPSGSFILKEMYDFWNLLILIV